MKILSRLVAVFLLLLFAAPLVGFKGKLAKVINAYHKDCWGKYCEASSALEQLLDLDTFQMEN